jgi:IclR family transcriptional regulator, pca regulon regulatory protein
MRRDADAICKTGKMRNMTSARPAAADAARSPGYFSDSLARGLLVIRAFDRDAPMLRITDVAKRTGLTRAAARRFLLTLLDLHYVGCSDDLYYLRPRALEIGYSYLSSMDTDRIIQPFLNELTDATRETSSFGVLDDFEVRLVARSASNRMLNFSVHLGGRVPAYSAALGRILLAGLPPEQFEEYWSGLPSQTPIPFQILDKDELRNSVQAARNQGYAVIERTQGEGMSSIAVPICSKAGEVVAAINVSEYPPRSNAQTMVRKYLPLLREAAKQIEMALGASPHATVALTQNGRHLPAHVG